MPPERLQKILAQAGYGSRRKCETLIVSGRIQVNGHIACIGDKADNNVDRITLDHKPIAQFEKLVYIILNKPRGVESSLAPQGSRVGIRDLITAKERLYPVGRLDADSEGLILLTNDGDLTKRLTHPSYGHEKEYRVLVNGYPNNHQLAVWRQGIVLDSGIKSSKANVRMIRKGASGTWLRVIIREGRKRQIRRSAEHLGLQVKRLKRVRLSTIRLGLLEPGDWRHMSTAELDNLRKEVLRPAHDRKGNYKWQSRMQSKDRGDQS